VDAALLAGNRDVLAQDEREASAGARSKPVTLLHRWKGRSAALTARIMQLRSESGDRLARLAEYRLSSL
jgi:hypothetical protein